MGIQRKTFKKEWRKNTIKYKCDPRNGLKVSDRKTHIHSKLRCTSLKKGA